MNYRDYEMKKKGQFQSVGMFGNNIYAYEILTGFCCVPEYYQITKDEFDTFEKWSKEQITDMGKLSEIHSRGILCSGNQGHSEIDVIGKEVRCPVCNESFLLAGGDIPDNIDPYKCCPNCNCKPEPKGNLIAEIKKQLNLAGVFIKDFGQELSSYHINPWSKTDMHGYVEVGNRYYYLRVNERGKIIIEYEVDNVKDAAYWILVHLIYKVEYEKACNNQSDYQKIESTVEKNMMVYFNKMDKFYSKCFLVGRNIFNFDRIFVQDKYVIVIDYILQEGKYNAFIMDGETTCAKQLDFFTKEEAIKWAKNRIQEFE